MNKKKDPNKLKVRENFTLTPEAAAKLDDAAERTGWKKSQIIEKLIREMSEEDIRVFEMHMKAIKESGWADNSMAIMRSCENQEEMQLPARIPLPPDIWHKSGKLMEKLIAKGVNPIEAGTKANLWARSKAIERMKI